MFYLLENNRIICDEEIINEYKGNLSNLKIEIKKNELKITYTNDRGIKYIVLEVGKIKNQSENVFDLIDWNNDLVRLTFKDGESFIVHCKINKSEFNDGFYVFEWISAIYKPDDKGNYIKVWERKENE